MQRMAHPVRAAIFRLVDLDRVEKRNLDGNLFQFRINALIGTMTEHFVEPV